MKDHEFAKQYALDLHELTKPDLIHEAKQAAMRVAQQRGTVTSTQVLDDMRANGLAKQLQGVDLRFMGAVFRSGWVRVGYTNTGSHKRPVSVWRRCDE